MADSVCLLKRVYGGFCFVGTLTDWARNTCSDPETVIPLESIGLWIFAWTTRRQTSSWFPSMIGTACVGIA